MSNSELYVAKNIEDLFIASMNRFQSSILFFGKLPKNIVESVAIKFGIDINEYSLVLDSDTLRHIYDRHFQDSQRFNIQHLDNLMDFIKESYFIECKRINNKIHFVFHTKKTENLFYLVCVLQTKRKRISVKTIYVKMEKLPNNLTLGLTSVTGFNAGKNIPNLNLNQVLL
jgi:hypothetical protein